MIAFKELHTADTGTRRVPIWNMLGYLAKEVCALVKAAFGLDTFNWDKLAISLHRICNKHLVGRYVGNCNGHESERYTNEYCIL
jgi:hypothetical protein